MYLDYPMAQWMYNMESPLLAQITKKKSGGEAVTQPVLYDLPQGRSRTFASANAKAKSGKNLIAGNVTFKWDKDYAIFWLQGQAIAAAQNTPYAYAESLATMSKLQLQTLINNRCTAIYGDGSGSRGRVKAITNSRRTVEFTDPNFNMNIGVDQNLVFSNVARGGALRAGGAATIDSVDASANTVTFTSALNAAVAANDYIFQEGDYIASGSSDIILVGLEGFVPDTVAANDNFRGLNRSKHRVKLAGTVHEQVDGETIEQTLLDAGAQLKQNTGQIDCLFMNPLTFNELVQELGPRVRYSRSEQSKTPLGVIGFEYITVSTAGAKGGELKVYSDPYCPRYTCWGIDKSTIEIFYIGDDFIFLDKIDGNNYLRDTEGDQVQGRFKSYANMHVKKPANLLKIKLKSA